MLDVGTERRGLLWNLSAGGGYVVVDDAPEAGEMVKVAFSLPNEGRTIHAEARVAWRNPPSSVRGCGRRAFSLPPGCGVEFVALDEGDLATIEAHVVGTTSWPPPLRRASA